MKGFKCQIEGFMFDPRDDRDPLEFIEKSDNLTASDGWMDGWMNEWMDGSGRDLERAESISTLLMLQAGGGDEGLHLCGGNKREKKDVGMRG